MAREPAVLAGNQQEPDPEKPDPVEYDCVFAAVAAAILLELRRELAVVRALPDVMVDVEARIEDPRIEARFYRVDAAPVRIVRAIGIDEGVLDPVAEHHH